MGEWLKDENGQYYRIIDGRIKEYRPTITTTNGTCFMDDVKQVKTEHSQQPQYTGKKCPFKEMAKKNNCSCVKTCVFYSDNACILASGKASETKGKPCPFMGTCQSNCALYKNGCQVTETIKQLKERI